jgi:3-oxoacyl-[acyl-carrier protein] reductase
MNQNKIALVTGVTRMKGIGKAICIELARQGIDIFFTYWRPYDKSMPWSVEDNEPEEIRQEILSFGGRCEKLEADLMNPESVDLIFNTLENTLGPASILVNNATYSTMTSIENISADELDKHYYVNLRATILLTSTFANRFKNTSEGRVINITSGQSLSAMSGEIAYAVTKGAIETFTRTMQHELAFKNITINAVNPGLTDSGWLDSGLMTQKQVDIFKKRFPKGRIGLPADAAKLIGFLAQEDSGWITGQIIHSEGGFIRENFDC